MMMRKHEAIVYIIDTEFLKDPEVFRRIYSEMPEYRRKKIDAYCFDKDKRLSLAAGFLLSEALRSAGICESELSLSVTANGRPYFRDQPDVNFSLSHSGSRAMCVLAAGPVGCDVEQIAGNEDIDLYRWTVMESYLKATDGVIDELLSFDPNTDTDYEFHEILRNDGYRYMVCAKKGVSVIVHENGNLISAHI